MFTSREHDMTSTEHRPPLRAAYPPPHDDRATWQRDRQRFAAFLTAKDLVLGYTRTATESAGRLAARLHLEGLFTMVRRSYGWLLGAASVAARGLRAPGVLAGLVWGLSTEVGQSLVGKAGRAVNTAVSTAAGAVGTAVGWTLQLFGTPGARLATWLGSKATAVTQAVTDRAGQLQRLSGLLQPQNLPAKAVGAIARERLIRTLVGRFLPSPWSWLVRIVANIALLPAAVLRDAGTVVAGVMPGVNPTPAPAPDGRTPATTAPTSPAPVPTVGPAEAPATPATPPAPLCTVDVPEPSWDGDLLEPVVGLEPTQLRYPAPKRSVAKKRR
jgi:hypothetical protein